MVYPPSSPAMSGTRCARRWPLKSSLQMAKAHSFLWRAPGRRDQERKRFAVLMQRVGPRSSCFVIQGSKWQNDGKSVPSEAHLQIIHQGLDVWNEWRQKNPELRPNLSGADLSEAHAAFQQSQRRPSAFNGHCRVQARLLLYPTCGHCCWNDSRR
jgi:hypothetical protein